jgi:hypothetical protein
MAPKFTRKTNVKIKMAQGESQINFIKNDEMMKPRNALHPKINSELLT